MIVEVGHFALILAAFVALLQGVLPLAGTLNGHQRWQALARPTAIVQFLLIAVSYAVLTNAAVTMTSLSSTSQSIPTHFCLFNTKLPRYGVAMKVPCCCGF